jgi:hypothetical protein
MTKQLFAILFLAILFSACQKSTTDIQTTATGNLIFKFKFDSTQVRLNSTGGVATIPATNAAMSPTMNKMTAHYVEMTTSAFTGLGAGAVLYRAPETTSGGPNAIDFSKAVQAGNGDVFLTVPIKSITPGAYEYIRVSVGYQNLEVKFHLDTTINVPPTGPTIISQDFPSTIAGFIGFNSYISSFNIKTQPLVVNANKLQGFWAAESSGTILGFPFNTVQSGQAPANATTVVNPIFATSPIPQGSCLVTGAFAGGNKLTITGAETKDIIVTVSMSTNKSFEWREIVNNGKWDPTKGEQVVDMGLRGMIPSFQ